MAFADNCQFAILNQALQLPFTNVEIFLSGRGLTQGFPLMRFRSSRRETGVSLS